MTVDPKIQKLHDMRAQARRGGGQARIDRQHAKGKLTARERIERLMDPGTFRELDMFVTHRTVGFGIYRLRPLHAFDSQLAAATVISAAAAFGGPVSTTHVVSSSIMGIGAAERPQAVRWGKATEIVFTWFVTLPAATMVAALTYMILTRLVA